MTALIFAPKRIAQIERGEKTQTRRLVKEGERHSWYDGIVTVFTPANRLKWALGCTRAIKPGRTAAGVGRVRITGICRECVRDISEADARAEGFASRQDFFDVWVDMYGEDALGNDCWVLEFEYLDE